MKNEQKIAQEKNIKAVVGLGNPGPKYYRTRHSIGFRVVDALAKAYGGHWTKKGDMEQADVIINGKKVVLIKPMTFMNDSGKVIPALTKQGIKPENILVVHDELEKPLGSLSFKFGGSARGHNGLRSLIAAGGKDFERLRFGIGRPEHKDEVSSYVLSYFKQEPEVEMLIEQAVDMICQIFGA